MYVDICYIDVIVRGILSRELHELCELVVENRGINVQIRSVVRTPPNV